VPAVIETQKEILLEFCQKCSYLTVMTTVVDGALGGSFVKESLNI
jgi:hypothetical protein